MEIGRTVQVQPTLKQQSGGGGGIHKQVPHATHPSTTTPATPPNPPRLPIWWGGSQTGYPCIRPKHNHPSKPHRTHPGSPPFCLPHCRLAMSRVAWLPAFLSLASALGRPNRSFGLQGWCPRVACLHGWSSRTLEVVTLDETGVASGC